MPFSFSTTPARNGLLAAAVRLAADDYLPTIESVPGHSIDETRRMIDTVVTTVEAFAETIGDPGDNLVVHVAGHAAQAGSAGPHAGWDMLTVGISVHTDRHAPPAPQVADHREVTVDGIDADPGEGPLPQR